jgi:hypothetical protein
LPVKETPAKETPAKYNVSTVKNTETAKQNIPKTAINPVKYVADPEEGEVRDPDPYAGKNTEGYVYYLQLGSFNPTKKVAFKKIAALKMGEIKQFLNKNGQNVYMLGAFGTLAEIYEVRQKVIDTGEVKDPFLLTYDKNGVLLKSASPAEQ